MLYLSWLAKADQCVESVVIFFIIIPCLSSFQFAYYINLLVVDFIETGLMNGEFVVLPQEYGDSVEIEGFDVDYGVR